MYAVSRRIVRWLNRLSPKLVAFGAKVVADELVLPHRESNAALRARKRGIVKGAAANDQAITVPMTIGDVSFMLHLTANPPWWDQYRSSSKTGKPYEPVMLACLYRILQTTSAPRFMDIGAYLGYYACYVSSFFGGREEVCAIESNPLYANAIRESARVNGFSHLRVFQAALSNRVEPVSIEGSTVYHHGDSRDTAMTVTLDQLCHNERLSPTIIKMDVHGAEGKIVLGMRSMLSNVEFLLLELHRLQFLEKYSPGVTRTMILDALEDAGLTLFYIGGHSGSVEKPFEDLMAAKAFSYRRLDRQARDLLLFDRGQDEFILALRNDDIGSLLGSSASPVND
jgi:FkbM family methyltransferase